MRRSQSTVRCKSDTFRAIAARRNLTLDELAKHIGIAERHFYRLLGGQVSPSPQKRAKICRALKLNFDELFEYVNSASEKRI